MEQSSASRPDTTSAPGRFLTRWHQVENAIALVAFSFIALLLMYDVLVREFLGPLMRLAGGDPTKLVIIGSQKMGVYALIVGAFCGIGIATATGVQLVPKVAFGWIPKSWGPSVDRLADLFSALFLFGAAWIAWTFVDSSRQAGMLTSGGIEVEAWKIQLALPLGIASAAVRYLAFAIWPATRPVPPEFQE